MQLVNIMMIFLILFKQIMLNILEASKPYRYYPRKFAEQTVKFKPHCRKYPSDYEDFRQRAQHFETEQQLTMGEMETERVTGYNELLIEYGWIVLFAPAFPIAGLLALLSNAIQFKTEKDSIKRFVKRGIPTSAMNIGSWLEYFELISTLGIINGACLIIFTSEKLTWFDNDGERDWTSLVIAVFLIENGLLVFRFLLASAIPDNPDWIEKQMFAYENRVKQVKADVDEKSMMDKVHTLNPVELVEQCLKTLHPDRDLASLLIPKLAWGADKFL